MILRLLLFIAVVLAICLFLYKQQVELFESSKSSPKLKTLVINLEKNILKWNIIKDTYKNTTIPIERFDAILGKKVVVGDWLNSAGIRDLIQVEKDEFRTHHYQLTRGAVGCFLSHYTIAKQLLKDATNDMYLVLEDDAGIRLTTFDYITQILSVGGSPDGWDIILLGTHRLNGKQFKEDFIKVDGFWGTFGYLLNKDGAKKFVDEVDKTKIDAQIDAYMSWMSQKNKLNLYATVKPVIFDNNITNQTDIQVGLKAEKGEDPFIYKGLVV